MNQKEMHSFIHSFIHSIVHSFVHQQRNSCNCENYIVRSLTILKSRSALFCWLKLSITWKLNCIGTLEGTNQASISILDLLNEKRLTRQLFAMRKEKSISFVWLYLISSDWCRVQTDGTSTNLCLEVYLSTVDCLKNNFSCLNCCSDSKRVYSLYGISLLDDCMMAFEYWSNNLSFWRVLSKFPVHWDSECNNRE